MKLTDFDTLTFDCYGTLIDWEAGIAAALQPLAARAGRAIDAEERVAAFGHHEHEEQARNPGALYPEILAGVHASIAREWGIDPDPALARAFGDSVPDWPAFPDSAEALRYLKGHFRLVILSNVHRAGFAASNKTLEVEFDAALDEALAHRGLSLIEVVMDPRALSPGATLDDVRAEGIARREEIPA